jgi:hypothetical protein
MCRTLGTWLLAKSMGTQLGTLNPRSLNGLRYDFGKQQQVRNAE